MTIFEAIFLGVLQGITEFLPISSSGHLVIAETLLGLHVDALKDFDIALHVGTLLAILVYFRKDLLNTKWWPWLILGSLPAALVGLTLEDQIDSLFRSASSVATLMILVGLLFFIPQRTTDKKLTWWRALLMGCGQAIAIIPGVSRSGATIFTGMQLGLNREEAARFSFLLGSIAIAGAGLLKALDTTALVVSPSHLLAGFLAAFFSSLLAATWLMKFLKKHSFKAFGVYRVLIGATALIVLNIYIGELRADLTLDSTEYTFTEGGASLVRGVYDGLELRFTEEIEGGILEFKLLWPSNETFFFHENSAANPTLPMTFDETLFADIGSLRWDGPVLAEFKVTFNAKESDERSTLVFEDYNVTLTEFFISEDQKLTLEAIYSATSENNFIEGTLSLDKTPLGVMLVD